MITILFRITRYGFQNFVRNGLLSTATIAVMVLALLVFLGLNLFGYITESSLAALKDKIDISVYFKTTVAEDEILRVKRSLESLSEIKGVEYVSRDSALEIFKNKHQGDATISRAVSELGYNPLLASLNIKADDPSQYAAISEYLNNESLNALIEKVTFAQNQKVIERLASIVDTIEKAGALLTIILSIVAGLVVFNTIRLALYSNREEIGIMRLVGASNAFIRGPYLITGSIYGVIAALISVLLITPVVFLVAPYLAVFIPSIDFKNYFIGRLALLTLYQLGLGILLGTASSYFAIRRHLKV